MLTRQRPYHYLTDRVIFLSIRFFTLSASGHTMVSQTGFFHFFFFFFKVVFDQDISGHTMVCQTGFFKKDILDWDINDPYHGLTDRVRGMVTDVLGQKSDKNPKIPLVWPLMLKKPGPGDRGMVTAKLGQNPEHQRPSSIKTSPD